MGILGVKELHFVRYVPGQRIDVRRVHFNKTWWRDYLELAKQFSIRMKDRDEIQRVQKLFAARAKKLSEGKIKREQERFKRQKCEIILPPTTSPGSPESSSDQSTARVARATASQPRSPTQL
jgi:hypothetical protein